MLADNRPDDHLMNQRTIRKIRYCFGNLKVHFSFSLKMKCFCENLYLTDLEIDFKKSIKLITLDRILTAGAREGCWLCSQ